MPRLLLPLLLLAGCAGSAVPALPAVEHDRIPSGALVDLVVKQVLRAAGASSGPREILVTGGDEHFNAAVAAKLERSRMRLPVTDTLHAVAIGTRGVRFSADTAVVTVELRHCSKRRGMNHYEETAELRFVEGPAWRFLRYTAIRHADGACGESARSEMETGVLDEEPGVFP